MIIDTLKKKKKKRRGALSLERLYRKKWARDWLYSLDRESNHYRQWRRNVYAKYNGKCAVCGSTENLASHHIKPWQNFPKLRFAVKNGMLLCSKHHAQKHPWLLEKEFNEEMERYLALPNT